MANFVTQNYYFSSTFLHYYVPVLLFFLFIWLVLQLAKKRKAIDLDNFESIVIWQVCAFSVLGMTIGIFVGNSREPAVEAVIPAVLSLLAGYAAYLFSRKNLQARLVISMAFIVLPIMLLYGAEIGADNRDAWEIKIAERNYIIALRKKILTRAVKEGTLIPNAPVVIAPECLESFAGKYHACSKISKKMK